MSETKQGPPVAPRLSAGEMDAALSEAGWLANPKLGIRTVNTLRLALLVLDLRDKIARLEARLTEAEEVIDNAHAALPADVEFERGLRWRIDQTLSRLEARVKEAEEENRRERLRSDAQQQKRADAVAELLALRARVKEVEGERDSSRACGNTPDPLCGCLACTERQVEALRIKLSNFESRALAAEARLDSARQALLALATWPPGSAQHPLGCWDETYDGVVIYTEDGGHSPECRAAQNVFKEVKDEA